jgi:hypothetical protein
VDEREHPLESVLDQLNSDHPNLEKYLAKKGKIFTDKVLMTQRFASVRELVKGSLA